MKTWHWGPKGNTNKSKADRAYPTQGPGQQWAKKDGWTPKHQCQEPTRSWCHFVTSLKKNQSDQVQKNPKRNKCHSNFHIAWNNLDTSNAGKAQGTEFWSRRFTPTRTGSIWDRQDLQKSHTLYSLYLEKATICHVLSHFHGLSARVGLFKLTATVWQDCFPVSKDTYPVIAVL